MWSRLVVAACFAAANAEDAGCGSAEDVGSMHRCRPSTDALALMYETQANQTANVRDVPSFYMHLSGLHDFTPMLSCFWSFAKQHTSEANLPQLNAATSDLLLLKRMATHPKRTRSPEEAEIHVIASPFGLAYGISGANGNQSSDEDGSGPFGCGTLRQYYNQTKAIAAAIEQSPYFQRQQGRNFLLVSSGNKPLSELLGPELHNVLQSGPATLATTNSGPAGQATFGGLKKVLLPQQVGMELEDEADEVFEESPRRARSSAFSYHHAVDQVASQWANMQDDLCQEVWGELNCQKGDASCKGGAGNAVFDCDSDEVAHKATSATRDGLQWDYLNSTFCLVPTDGRLASNRLFQTLASGCVPVVLGDFETVYPTLPFKATIDWSQALIFAGSLECHATTPPNVVAAKEMARWLQSLSEPSIASQVGCMSAYGRSIATETLSYGHDGIVSALLRQAVVSAEETARQVPKPQVGGSAVTALVAGECESYLRDTGCGWTKDYACPGKTGVMGLASDDGTVGYRCCCNGLATPTAAAAFARRQQEQQQERSGVLALAPAPSRITSIAPVVSLESAEPVNATAHTATALVTKSRKSAQDDTPSPLAMTLSKEIVKNSSASAVGSAVKSSAASKAKAAKDQEGTAAKKEAAAKAKDAAKKKEEPEPEPEATVRHHDVKTRADDAQASPAPEASPAPKASAFDACEAVEGTNVAKEWCVANCGNTPPNCPATLCTCPTELKLGVALASNSSGAPRRLDFDRLTKGMDNSVAAKVLEKMEQTRRLKELRAKVKQLEESKSGHSEAAKAASPNKGMQQQAALVPMGTSDALLVPKPRPKEHNANVSKKAAASTRVASARVKVARAKAAKKIVDAAKVVDAAKARVASATAKRVVLASAQGGAAAAAKQNRSLGANMIANVTALTALSADEEKVQTAQMQAQLQEMAKQAQLEISRVRDAEQSLAKREAVMAQREQAWVAVKAKAKGSTDASALKFEDAEATALQMARLKAEAEADIIRSRAKNEAEAELKQAHLKVEAMLAQREGQLVRREVAAEKALVDAQSVAQRAAQAQALAKKIQEKETVARHAAELATAKAVKELDSRSKAVALSADEEKGQLASDLAASHAKVKQTQLLVSSIERGYKAELRELEMARVSQLRQFEAANRSTSAELHNAQEQAAALRLQVGEVARAAREAELKAEHEHAALLAQDEKMARVEHGLPPAAAAASETAATASAVALLAAKPAAVAEKPPVVSLKNKIMMLGQLAKARQQKALQSKGIAAPVPHSPNHPATPKIVMIKAMDAAAPKAKAAAKVYAAKDCSCEWAGADHDRDGRADGCNGGDDGSICWSACCSPSSLLPPIFLQQQEEEAADAIISFLELTPSSDGMQAKLDAVLASGVVPALAAGTAPQETSAATAPQMFAAAAAALAATSPTAAAVTAAAAATEAAPAELSTKAMEHASRLEKLKASVAKLQKDKEARMGQASSLAAAAAAAADPSLQKYFPQQTGVQLPGAELATQMTQRASSPATTQPAAGEPIGPHSGVKWTAQETQQVAAVAAAAAAAAESQQAQAQEAAATMGLGAQQALAPTQQGHEQGQQQAVAEYQSQQAAPSQQQEAPSQQQEAPSQQSEQSHESEQDRAQRLARQIVTGDLQGQQGQQALLRNDMPRVSELPFERTEGHSRKWMELSQRNSMLADAARRAAESEHSRVLHEEQMRIDEAERLAVLAEAEATRLVRARLLQADQMKTRIQAEARSRMETAKIALKSAQDNSLIRSEEADRAKAAVETADEEARARVRAEEAARREKAEIDRIAKETADAEAAALRLRHETEKRVEQAKLVRDQMHAAAKARLEAQQKETAAADLVREDATRKAEAAKVAAMQLSRAEELRMESAESAMREAESALHSQTLKLETERSARMADGKARIQAAIAARKFSETSEQLRKTSETVVTSAPPPQQQAAAAVVEPPQQQQAAAAVEPPPQQQQAAAAAVLQTALERKTSEVVGGEQSSVGRVQDFFNAAATAANASISAATVAAAAAAVGASPPSNATAAATTGVSADALAMAALAANTASEPDVSAAKVEQEKTSEEMQAELESLNADPLMQEAEARRREFLEARGAVALPTLENVTIPADGAAALETKPAPFDPNLASLLMSPQMSSKATNLMATETERPLPAASSIAKALRSDLAFRKEVPMKLL
jgi:hypothetical protein